jgi:MEDS: MEthanogen/methylotroph, DcmR Sensory domain
VSVGSLVHDTPTPRHEVWVYDDPDELSHAVAQCLDEGFRAGAPALVVVTPEQGRHIAEELAAARGTSTLSSVKAA